MTKIIFIDSNGNYLNIEKHSENFEYIKSDDFNENIKKPWGICVGGLSDPEVVERIKKIIINYKINGAFVMVSPDIGENGNMFSFADKELIKKLKELSLFANAVYLNFTEACAFANFTYKEKCSRENAEALIFKLNSYGMANKLIITDFPGEDGTISSVISEFGECEIIPQSGVICKKAEFGAYILSELSNGEKIIPAVHKSLEQI